MASSERIAPGFLIASPKLDGSVFERAVIMMVHHDEEGAMGFIVNRPLEVDFGSLLEMVEVEHELIADDCYEREVFFGGPVRVEQLWVIYEGGEREVTASADFESFQQTSDLRFHDRWALSGASDSIEELAFGQRRLPYKPFIGYAGWDAGQLEGEIGEGSWLMLDFEPELITGADPEQMWELALARIGIDEQTFLLMGKGGVA